MKSKNPITLSPQVDSDLSILGVDRIILRKIISNSTNIHTLFAPIKVSTDFTNGSSYSYFISPIQYFSNRNPGIMTDRPMSEKIKDCKFTKLSVFPSNEISENYELTIEYDIITFIPVVAILINQQTDGMVFGLEPTSKINLKKVFPEAVFAGSVFIDQSTKTMFEYQHGTVFPHVLKALTGLNDDEIFSIGKVRILNPSDGNKIILEFDPNKNE
jgi:hypothetical protein